MEDLRDEKLSSIILGFQNKCRWYLALKEKRRRLDQQMGALVLQMNLRAWCTVRSWGWYKLFQMVKPLLEGDKKGQKMEELETLAKVSYP